MYCLLNLCLALAWAAGRQHQPPFGSWVDNRHFAGVAIPRRIGPEDASDGLDGQERCAAVVERSNQLKTPIRFMEAEQYQCGDKIFTTYRAQGEFHSTGRSTCARWISIRSGR